MTLPEFENHIRALLPEATVETDNHGQIVVYTNLKMKDENNYQSELVPFVSPDL